MKKVLSVLVVFAAIFGFTLIGAQIEETIFGIKSAALASAPVLMIANKRTRDAYQALKSIPGISIEESYLQSEAILNNTTSEYEFQLRKISSALSTPHTQLLDQNDVFVTTSLLLAFRENDSTKPEELPFGKLQTYVNPEYFTANAGFTPAHVAQIYAGQLSFKVADRLYFQYLSTGKFLSTPETQLDTTAGTFDSVDAASAGKYVTPQIMIISGSEDTTVTAKLKTFVGIQWAQTAANKQVVLALVQDGLLIRGGANRVGDIARAISLVG